MKSFLKYISEDIEVMGTKYTPDVSGFRKFDQRQIDYLHNPYSQQLQRAPRKILTDHGDLGEHHRLYSMVYGGYDKPFDPAHETYHYYVVDKETNDIATILKTKAYDSPLYEKKLLKIDELTTHPRYRKKRSGYSIPNLLYKRLSEMGHPIQSSSLQSQGGADVWNQLRKDSEVGPRMFLQLPTHEVIAHGGDSMIPAMNLKDSDIWGLPEKQIAKAKVEAERDPDKVSKHFLTTLILLPPNRQTTK